MPPFLPLAQMWCAGAAFRLLRSNLFLSFPTFFRFFCPGPFKRCLRPTYTLGVVPGPICKLMRFYSLLSFLLIPGYMVPTAHD